MIVRMKLATPTEGLMTLSDTLNPRLFRMAKAGLGSLGVVTELSLRCVPSHKLLEYTFTLPTNSLADRHYNRLSNFRHARYMWFPYTSKVCVVVSNPTAANDSKMGEEAAKIESELLNGVVNSHKLSTKPATTAMSELLLQLQPHLDRKTVHALSFSQLRDHLLDTAPLDTKLVKRINAAEAEFWERSTGYRADDSAAILGFDCGGEQWVYEVCFPIGPLAAKTGKDLQFVRQLLQVIEKHQLPAPGPIEQRWTARSTAPMSPAYSENPDEVFSWVGIIMYLPPNQSDAQRQEITRSFRQYVELMRPLCEEYGAQAHWAKIEPPTQESVGDRLIDTDEVSYLQRHLQKKYPVKEFNQYRDALDPRRILSNELIETLFGK
jgi:L-galactono-1,4-lactone dehydrogenase